MLKQIEQEHGAPLFPDGLDRCVIENVQHEIDTRTVCDVSAGPVEPSFFDETLGVSLNSLPASGTDLEHGIPDSAAGDCVAEENEVSGGRHGGEPTSSWFSYRKRSLTLWMQQDGS